MGRSLTQLSKFLVFVLRHTPETFGIVLDEQGFAPIDVIWHVVIERFGTAYDQNDLADIVKGDSRGKKRYEIADDKIRALYGHSQPTIRYEAIIPPTILYHGTNATALKQLQVDGLQAIGRQYVHMTTNLGNATLVAKRKTKQPIMLSIHALEAHESGIVFHQAEDEHYLALAIPPQFIKIKL